MSRIGRGKLLKVEGQVLLHGAPARRLTHVSSVRQAPPSAAAAAGAGCACHTPPLPEQAASTPSGWRATAMHPPFSESFTSTSTIGRRQRGRTDPRGETHHVPSAVFPGWFTRAFSQSGSLHRIKSFPTATSAIPLPLHISVRARQPFLALFFRNTSRACTGQEVRVVIDRRGTAGRLHVPLSGDSATSAPCVTSFVAHQAF